MQEALKTEKSKLYKIVSGIDPKEPHDAHDMVSTLSVEDISSKSEAMAIVRMFMVLLSKIVQSREEKEQALINWIQDTLNILYIYNDYGKLNRQV